ncbi:glucose-1-phosphate thymidylyltransferase [Olivibacter sp. SDN3]|uniref:putative sugar nucleotidyl transferase n=1 Tax=Olivibacter sp. SDN3 TaxID=2764720 RepID=UPI0016510C38|nr:putative sugar nucleotidyl transferase [Olivibacter sp. SDN3]QNL49001.1 glucose-1-phosphate thymidylyltransferase [Olivibacter sp. SDN3]
MQIVLYDNDEWRAKLYPLSLTRPVADLRVGILTIGEKWSKWLKQPVSFLTEEYLKPKYPTFNQDNDVLLIRAGVCPDERLCTEVMSLKAGEKLVNRQDIIAIRTTVDEVKLSARPSTDFYRPLVYVHDFVDIVYPEDIFINNGIEIRKDFQLLTAGRISATLSSTNTILGENIFVEEGAVAECCIINTLKGPVYLGRNSEIWEGTAVRGSFALGDDSQVKMGAKIYSNVTVGPGCRVGGELNTCVIWGNSSKGHEGYFGSGVMGEWCNWGADTNNSNLKNNYKNVRVYDYKSDSYRDTGLQFYGLIMGDHSKCAINTSFNTGTVVGVSASIFGGGVPPTFVPDFSWGNHGIYELEKMFSTAKLVFARRNRKFDNIEQSILNEVFEITRKQRD